MVRLIMFDLGGVVVKNSNEQYYASLVQKYDKPYKLVKSIMYWAERVLNVDRMSLKEVTKIASKKIGIKPSQVQWLEYFRDNSEIDHTTIKIIRQLKENYKIAYLSNVDKARYVHVKRLLGKDMRLFDYKFASCDMRLQKPNPAIFRKALKKAHLKAGEVVFIDDIFRNVAAARTVGIRTIQFKSAIQLKKDLKRLGVKL